MASIGRADAWKLPFTLEKFPFETGIFCSETLTPSLPRRMATCGGAVNFRDNPLKTILSRKLLRSDSAASDWMCPTEFPANLTVTSADDICRDPARPRTIGSVCGRIPTTTSRLPFGVAPILHRALERRTGGGGHAFAAVHCGAGETIRRLLGSAY